MSTSASMQRIGPLLDRLMAAVEADDLPEFEHLLNELVHSRRKDLLGELRRLTAKVQSALDRFQFNARFNALATRDIQEARQRLAYVLQETDQAAHRTLTLIEQSAPLVEVLAGDGDGATEQGGRAEAAQQLRENLSEMLMAQSFQDLTGQVLRGLITLVGEVEGVLGELILLTEGDRVPSAENRSASASGYGPVIPGIESTGAVVTDQQGVDSLLSGLGL